jgi:hypothetical protein
MSRRTETLPSAPLAVALMLVLALAACSDIYYDRRQTVSFHSGDAVEVNKIAQTVDPWPLAAGNRNIESNGVRMQSAIERYRTNRVIPPQGTGTSSVPYTPVTPPPAPVTTP